MKLKNHFYYLFILAWIILDQLSKYLIARSISLYQVVTVIPGFFNLTRVHNRGAIFGFLSNSQYPRPGFCLISGLFWPWGSLLIISLKPRLRWFFPVYHFL